VDGIGGNVAFKPTEEHVKLAKENIPEFRSKITVEELELERLRRLYEDPACPPQLKAEFRQRMTESELRLWTARESLAFLESLTDGDD
jgi:hypothetical protein